MDQAHEAPLAVETSPVEAAELQYGPPQRYKSFKKKYNKMRYRFKDKMRESTILFNAEQKAMRTASRLLEETDFYLDLLLDLNTSRFVIPRLQYNLDSPPPTPTSLDSATASLTDGTLSYAALRAQQARALGIPTTAHPRALALLAAIPHSRLHDCAAAAALPLDVESPLPEARLDNRHADEHLAALLDAVEAGGPVAPAQAARAHEREREAALKNPASVYNWLRKHHPNVFLQDGEPGGEKRAAEGGKGGRGDGAAGKQTKKAAKEAKVEELADGDVFAIGLVPSESKAKRKRDDEPYRPKGGGSRPHKKKKISGDKKTVLGSEA